MGTGGERSQGCAHTDNRPAGRLPRPLQQHFPPRTGMRQRPLCATKNPSGSAASCYIILLLAMGFDGQDDQNGNSSSSVVTHCFVLT